MKCQNCGNKVKNNRYCTSCGQPVLIKLDLTTFQEEKPFLYKQALEYYQQRQYEWAKINLYELILKHSTNSNYHNLLGCVYLKQEKDNLAVLHFERALKYDPISWQAYYNLGIIFTRQGDYERAKKMFKAVLGVKERHLSSLYNLGTILLKEGNYPAAVTELTKVNEINPHHNNNLINLNLALKKLKD